MNLREAESLRHFAGLEKTPPAAKANLTGESTHRAGIVDDEQRGNHGAGGDARGGTTGFIGRCRAR